MSDDDDRASIRDIQQALPEEDQSLRMGDLVVERSDLIRLRNGFYKPIAKLIREAGYKCSVTDLIALSSNNDPFYIGDFQVEQANWYAEIDNEEENPTTHPRGMHYSILDKYDDRDGEPYIGDVKQWGDLLESARYASLLGFVPSKRILDGKNADPKRTEFGGSATGIDTHPTYNIRNGYSGPIVYQNISKPEVHKNIEDLIESNAKKITEAVFKRAEYSGEKVQPYYIEVICEKGAILPEKRLQKKYNVTTRPADGGEPSAKMCEDAVRIADERDQGLVVVMVSDFDGKGADMPKSVARKVEVEAAIRNVEAHVHQAALTKDQVAELDLPFAPGTVPKGADNGTTGAKAFQTTNELFAAFAGTNGKIEVNALANEHPEVLWDSITRYIKPYHDDNRDEQLKESISDERERFERAIRDRFEERRDEIQDARDDLKTTIDTYNDQVDNDEINDIEGEINDIEDEIDVFEAQIDTLSDELLSKSKELRGKEEEVRMKTGLDSKASALDNVLDMDLASTISAFNLNLPDADVEGRDDAILDTRRTWIDQLDAYREFDYRWDNRREPEEPPNEPDTPGTATSES